MRFTPSRARCPSPLAKTRRPPVVTHACGSSDAPAAPIRAPARRRGPSIPSTESVRDQNLGDDLFHEPEAQPQSVTAEVPPETTVGGSPPRKATPSVIQAGLTPLYIDDPRCDAGPSGGTREQRPDQSVRPPPLCRAGGPRQAGGRPVALGTDRRPLPSAPRSMAPRS